MSTAPTPSRSALKSAHGGSRPRCAACSRVVGLCAKVLPYMHANSGGRVRPVLMALTVGSQMREVLRVLSVTAALSIYSANVGAQAQPSLPEAAEAKAQPARLAPLAFVPGTAIRIHDARGQTVEGRLVTSNRDSIHLSVSARQVAVPTTDVTAIDVRLSAHERRSRSLQGAGIGAFVGGLLGTVVGAAEPVEDSCAQSCFLDTSGLDKMANMATGLLVGAGIGGVLGAVVGFESSAGWQPVQLHRISASRDMGPHRRSGAIAAVTVSVKSWK